MSLENQDSYINNTDNVLYSTYPFSKLLLESENCYPFSSYNELYPNVGYDGRGLDQEADWRYICGQLIDLAYRLSFDEVGSEIGNFPEYYSLVKIVSSPNLPKISNRSVRYLFRGLPLEPNKTIYFVLPNEYLNNINPESNYKILQQQSCSEIITPETYYGERKKYIGWTYSKTINEQNLLNQRIKVVKKWFRTFVSKRYRDSPESFNLFILSKPVELQKRQLLKYPFTNPIDYSKYERIVATHPTERLFIGSNTPKILEKIKKYGEQVQDVFGHSYPWNDEDIKIINLGDFILQNKINLNNS